MGSVCSSGVFLSGRWTLTACLIVCLQQMLWLVRPSSPPLPEGNLKCRVCRKKKALLWSKAPDRSSCDEWGLGAWTSVVTISRPLRLDLLLGFWENVRNACVRVCLCEIERVFVNSNQDFTHVMEYKKMYLLLHNNPINRRLTQHLSE